MEISDDPAAEVPPATAQFVQSLSVVLDYLSQAEHAETLTHFDAVRPPAISIARYLKRIETYFGCSPECFVLALVYLDRVVILHPEFTISKRNIHRLIVTSIMLAVKFFDDVYYSNAYYARVGGVRTREMNMLEEQLLELIGWNLYVSPPEYEHYMQNVLLAVGTMPAGEGEDAALADAA